MTESSEYRVHDPAAVLADRGITEEPEDSDVQVSQAGSSYDDPSTTAGGADAVPDTPDDVPENNIEDAEHQDYRRTGRDVQQDQLRSGSNPG